MLTQILHNRPPNAREYIVECLSKLKTMKSDDPHSNELYQLEFPFLGTEDFEAIFESYDVLGIQTVPIAYLI